jgi:glutamine cyclotransferase
MLFGSRMILMADNSFSGSAFLHFWDRQTLEFKRKHQVMRLSGLPANNINELEFWRDRVVANVWFEHVLIIINPVTGLVEKEYGTCGYSSCCSPEG